MDFEESESRTRIIRNLPYLQGSAESRLVPVDKAEILNPYMVHTMNHSELGVVVLCAPKY